MKALFTLITAALALSSVSALAYDAVTYVPYGDNWTYIPYCGGYTRLVCHGPRRDNECNVEFSGTSCPMVNMYTGSDFYPNRATFESEVRSSFFVDNNKINQYSLSFRVFLHNSDNSRRAKLVYQFNY